MRLSDLIRHLELETAGDLSVSVTGLAYDSRRVTPGSLFFALPGRNTDGRAFIAQALARGAAAVLSDRIEPGLPVPCLAAPNPRAVMAQIARRFHGDPSSRLRVIGVTGTNGKTTATFMLKHLLDRAHQRCGLVGTVRYDFGGRMVPASRTTPESADLQELFAKMRDNGCRAAAIEVSSIALAERRADGVRFAAGVFTNLTQDHLDFHGTMEDYFASKHRLFEGAGGPPPAFAILNADDLWARKIQTAPSTVRWSYGLEQQADFRAENIDAGFHGLRFDIRHPQGRCRIESPLCGRFNVYNLTAAFAAGVSLGLEPEAAAAGLSALRAVPGRFERVDAGQPFLVIVDYAHTEDALRNLIESARALSPRRVITVFGCGGDRDKLKRPRMGETAAALSDLVIVTSDNPRSENPLDIIRDILVGVRRHDTPHRVEPDRETAIRLAVESAAAGDIVLIAGKGHENYQVLADRTIAFDDREVARRILESLGYGPAGEGAA